MYPSQTRGYAAWKGMMARCYNPNDKDYYHGKVSVHGPWKDVKVFLAEMGEPPSDKHTLSRINTREDFLPGNLIWLENHRMSKSGEYQTWKNMLARCGQMGRAGINKRHGMRGIVVCDRWLVFDNFIADMGSRPTPEHSLDRIDNDGDYSPENCRWATREVQANNRGDNHMLTYNGETLSVSQWARKLGLEVTTMFSRLRLGVEGDRLFSPKILTNMGKRVEQRSKNGDLLAVFVDTKAAVAATGLGYAAISKCLSGGNRSCGGFLWRYIE